MTILQYEPVCCSFEGRYFELIKIKETETFFEYLNNMMMRMMIQIPCCFS